MRKLWKLHKKIHPLYTKSFKLFIELFYLIKEKIKYMDSIEKIFKCIAILTDNYEKFKTEFLILEIYEINKPYDIYFNQEMKREMEVELKTNFEQKGIKTFHEIKLSEPPIIISEKITLIFTPLIELSQFIKIDNVTEIITAYKQNSLNRLAACKKAFESLKKLKINVDEQDSIVDPKTFAIRLEAESAFIDKYLSKLEDLNKRKLEDY